LRERPDAPLGTLIFRAGLLPAETIENALEEGVKTGRRLGEILIERGLLQEEDLTRLLAGQKGLPFVSLRSEPIDPETTKLLSEDQARLFSALPIRLEEGLPLVAVADPTNDVLNRNIREALGQDVRFVVAGRSELNDVIGEAYSGALRTMSPAPIAEPEPVEPAPLRVDTSIPPTVEEPPAPAYEPETEVESAPGPTFVPADPEPAFEAPIFEAPAVEHEPEPEPEPEPEVETGVVPKPEPDPVTAFEAPATEFEPPAATELEPPAATELEPPAPVFETPVAPEPAPEAPLTTEPMVPPSLPEANGQVPHDELLGVEPPIPEASELPAEPSPVPDASEAPASSDGAGFTVSVRLTSGERLTVAQCDDIGEAKGYAKALTKQLGTSDSDDWPFVNGRFLKPDTIVSVDVEPS
jgi:type IV pilus assembly protein PilB